MRNDSYVWQRRGLLWHQWLKHATFRDKSYSKFFWENWSILQLDLYLCQPQTSVERDFNHGKINRIMHACPQDNGVELHVVQQIHSQSNQWSSSVRPFPRHIFLKCNSCFSTRIIYSFWLMTVTTETLSNESYAQLFLNSHVLGFSECRLWYQRQYYMGNRRHLPSFYFAIQFLKKYGLSRGFKTVEFEFRVRVRVSSNFCTFDKYQNGRVV